LYLRGEPYAVKVARTVRWERFSCQAIYRPQWFLWVNRVLTIEMRKICSRCWPATQQLQSQSSNSLGLSFIISIAFYSSLLNHIPSSLNIKNFITLLFNNANLSFDVNYVSGDNWDGNLMSITDISSIGNLIYSSHFIWLIITSIVLLVAMIGAIVMTVDSVNRITNINSVSSTFYNKSPLHKNPSFNSNTSMNLSQSKKNI